MGRRERMKRMIDDVWFLKRDLVSDDFDLALERLGQELPLNICEYESGREVWTWIVPDKWTCHEAYVETLDGKRIIDYQDHPLHCATYASSFEGVIGRDELFEHLLVHPHMSDAIPYSWLHYKTDWRLCCTQEQKAQLTEDSYRVVVRTEHTPGMMKVGEVVIPGETEQEIVICAHLCHPHMANDDLAGVVVAIEVMRHLSQQSNHYTYRLLLPPETIGSVAWLSEHEALIPNIVGGLFIEMIGNDSPHALQMSYLDDSEIDQCFWSVLKQHDPQAWQGAFRRVIGNDERQFNAPGVRIPMLSLSRVFHPDTGKWPTVEYHSSKDTPDALSLDRMEESVDVIVAMLKRFESNLYPVNLFRGEVFCSRYGLFIDFYKDPKNNLKLFDIMHCIDGTRTILEIANHCDVTFDDVEQVITNLKKHHLVDLARQPLLKLG